MARTGKIARLPHALREQVNQRLLNNETSTRLLDWLNAQPEAIELWEIDFEGVPASPQNLSEWRLGGFKEWRARRDRVEHLKSLTAHASDIAQTGMGLSGAGATIAAGEILGVFETITDFASGDNEESLDPIERLDILTKCIKRLRDGDLKAGALDLNKERHRLQEEQHQLNLEKYQNQTAEKFLEWANSKDAAAILDSGKPKHELLAGIRKLMFGEAPE